MKKSRLMYAGLFLTSLIFIYFYSGKIPYMFFYTIVLFPVLSFLHLLIIRLRFKFNQELDKKIVVKGDTVNFIVNVGNEDIFPYPYINISFHHTEGIFIDQFKQRSFSLQPFQKKSFTIKLDCKYRGSFGIGVKSIEIIDFLGLFRLRYKIKDIKHLTVNPRIVPLLSFQINTDYTSESNSIMNNRFEDMTTAEDVRSYYPGDSLKRVHWKLSAKSQKMMVRKFQSTSENNVVMLLDLQADKRNANIGIMLEDKLVEAFVAVIHYCLSNWIPVNMVYFKNGLNSIEARNHLMFGQIYDLLAKVDFTETVPVKDLLEVYVKDVPDKSYLLVFTLNLDYELYNQIYKTSLSGYDISLVYISDHAVESINNTDVDKILGYMPEIGVSTYNIGVDDDVRQLLEPGGLRYA